MTATGKVEAKDIFRPRKERVQVAVEARDSTGDLIGLSRDRIQPAD